MSKTALQIKGARAFGIHLGVGPDGDLVYDARYDPSSAMLEKIAAHEAEILANLRPRRDAAAALLDQIQDLDSEQYLAFVNVERDQLDVARCAFDAMEAVAAIVAPVMRTERKTWRAAVQWLLNHPSFRWYARHRPRGYRDEHWLLACYQAREFGLKAPLKKTPVAHVPRQDPV